MAACSVPGTFSKMDGSRARLGTNKGGQEEHESSGKEVARLPNIHPQEVSRRAAISQGVRGACLSRTGDTGDAEQGLRANVPSLPSTAYALQVSIS